MEAEIKKFLNGSGYGDGSESGDGSGYGDGSGNGCGCGSGNGSGYGSESGDGSGYGDGDGSGYGYGSESGDGSGYGDGDGSGYGYGSESGDGSGDGDGDGSGYGYGSESGDGSGDGDGCGSGDGSESGDGSGYEIKIKTYKGQKVYYIDNIPCIFRSVHDNFASVEVVKTSDFTTKKAFLGRFENCIAHGLTIREAIEDARSKYYQSLNFEEGKEKLLTEFKNKGKLTVKELYDWHGILTGSCRFGRFQFQQEHNLKDDDLLSLTDFVKLTGSAFGGDKIKALV